MKVKFWGAARTVTGSMHLLELKNGKRILLECGLYQGNDELTEDFNSSFPCEPETIDYMILSHAHIDHCGNIPQLVKKGFKGNIFCTHATYDLCTIMLADSAMIQEKDAEQENKYREKRGLELIKPNYTVEDVPAALNLFFTLPYDKWFSIDPDVEIMFRDAGHMLGSATVNMRIKEDKKLIRLGFTGDVGRPDRQILRDPQPMPEADYLICESTYGGKDHELLPAAARKLKDIIEETCIKNRGKLIIPAFSVGRTQDIVHSLDKLENEGLLPHVPIYVDSPLAVNATRIYELHPECFDEELVTYMRNDPDPFGFNRLHYIRHVNESKKLNNLKGPCVIISASGMITAGRILHHITNHIQDRRNTVLIVGYCAANTIGARLVEGAETIKIYGQELRVKAKIEKLNAFSAHAGQTELYDFISNHKSLKKVFLVHGEGERSFLFKDFLATKGLNQVEVPERSQSFEL